jgi:hypothetical protein
VKGQKADVRAAPNPGRMTHYSSIGPGGPTGFQPLYEWPTIRDLVGCERAAGELALRFGDGLMMAYSVNRAVHSRRGPVLMVVSGRAVRA